MLRACSVIHAQDVFLFAGRDRVLMLFRACRMMDVDVAADGGCPGGLQRQSGGWGGDRACFSCVSPLLTIQRVHHKRTTLQP